MQQFSLREQRTANDQDLRSMLTALDYLDGSLTVEGAMARLDGLGPITATYAGEICLQAAQKDDSRADYWLDYANRHYVKAARLPERLNETPPYYWPAIAKSRFRLAQWPVYHSLTIGELPPLDNLSGVYTDTVYRANELSDALYALRRQRSAGEAYTKCLGELAEMAVILLGQRFALREQLPDWLASLTLIANDKGRSDDFVRHWDVDIFMADDGHPVLTNKVQVKSQKNFYDISQLKYTRDIDMLYVYPDLAINREPPSLVPLIITKECCLELGHQGPVAPKGNRRLDRRTDKMLDAIG